MEGGEDRAHVDAPGLVTARARARARGEALGLGLGLELGQGFGLGLGLRFGLALGLGLGIGLESLPQTASSMRSAAAKAAEACLVAQ